MPGTFTIGGGAARALSVNINVKAIKAKCEENQEALDRLQEHMIKAQQQANSNYYYSLKRAVASLRDCRHPITSRKEAVELKHIGPKLAGIMLPSAAAATSGPVTKTEGKKKAAATKKVAPLKRQNSTSLSSDTTTAATASSSSSFPPSAKEKAYNKAKKEAQNLELPPQGPWKVILIVDGREHKSKQIVSQCKQSGIPCEERHLPIGDMAWIARCSGSKGNSTEQQQQPLEIMIGTILERKDVEDFRSSLFGTRYNEQRLRLSQCGLPQVLFLVEGNLHHTDVAANLQMAMAETRIHLGFQVVQTKDKTDTVRLLKGMHRRIVQRTFPEVFDKDEGIAVPSFGAGQRLGGDASTGRRRNRRPSSLLEMVFDSKPKPPFGASRFITYAELKAKVEFDREQGTKSVGAISSAMVKQIPTVSHAKCTAIAPEYPTMNRLIETLCFWEGNRQKLISEIPLDQKRTIGPKSADEIIAACCTLGDGSTVTSSTESDQQPAKKKARRTPKAKAKNASTFAAATTASNSAVAGQPVIRESSAAKSMFPIDGGLLSDDSAFEVAPVGSFDSRKRPAVKANSAAAPKSAPARKASRPTTRDLDDSLLLSSPDDFLSRPSRQPSKLSAREAAAAAAEKRAAMAKKPAAAAAFKAPPEANSSPLVIDILDSDSDEDSPMGNAGLETAKNDNQRFETDLQRAIRLSMLDTPSTNASAKTPGSLDSLASHGMPSTEKQTAARKVSKSSEKPEVDDSLLMSSPEQETSLRERLANRLDREVIEIDLD